MKPVLRDRRVGATTDLAPWQGAAGERIATLVAGIGKPTWPVGLALVSDEEMTELNGRYRDRWEVTDVLSFSYLETTGLGPPDLPRAEGYAARDLWREPGPAGDEDAVGDLVVAPGFVRDRCSEKGWPLDVEIPWLVVHGCLHLVGWDHEDPAELAAMQAWEVKILAAAGLQHPLRPRS